MPLSTPIPPLGENSDVVPNTRWVNINIEYGQRPRCVGNTGLNVRVTKGRIRKEGCSEDLISDPNYTPTYIYTNGVSNVSVLSNKREYAWLRYSDKQIVVSEAQPSPKTGDLIAVIYTGDTAIQRIENYDGWDCPPSSVVYCCPDDEIKLEFPRSDVNIQEETVQGLPYIYVSKDLPVNAPTHGGDIWIQVKNDYRAMYIAVQGGNGSRRWSLTNATPIMGVGSPKTQSTDKIPIDHTGQFYINEGNGELWVNIHGTWTKTS